MFYTQNPPCPLVSITTHTPTAISTAHTLLFDSRMRTESQVVQWLSWSHAEILGGLCGAESRG